MMRPGILAALRRGRSRMPTTLMAWFALIARHAARYFLICCTIGIAAAPSAAQPSHQGKSLDLPTGVSIYYEASGNGSPLLILHGGLGLDHNYFRPWLDSLGKKLRLIYPDLRANGRSSHGRDKDFTLEHLVDDLEALRHALGISRWAVMGHSFGGFVALEYALLFPNRTSRLILVDTSANPALPENDNTRHRKAEKTTPAIAAALKALDLPGSNARWKHLWHCILPLYFVAKPPQRLIAGDRIVYRDHARFLGYRLLQGLNFRAVLRRIRVPTLLVAGRDDLVLPTLHSKILHNGIHTSRLVIVPRAGHFPFIERPRSFRRIVLSFLDRETAPRRHRWRRAQASP
jgi:proline iminopeptidase